MNYFSVETIFIIGIITGVAMAISAQLAIKELFHQRRTH